MQYLNIDCLACGYGIVKNHGKTLLGGTRYQCARCGFNGRTQGNTVNLVLAIILLAAVAVGMVVQAAYGQLGLPGILTVCVLVSLVRSTPSSLERSASAYKDTKRFREAMSHAWDGSVPK
ncbi:MAG TPA: hypothetical protein VNT79_06570 [Phycisphaerae bacterium]|nr:hypothetical protein [Phycisphaerae bacterium]